jgi:hypothetical protein
MSPNAADRSAVVVSGDVVSTDLVSTDLVSTDSVSTDHSSWTIDCTTDATWAVDRNRTTRAGASLSGPPNIATDGPDDAGFTDLTGYSDR